MLSTVVLPAPFGPIRLVTRPGSAVERHVGRGAHAAEGDGRGRSTASGLRSRRRRGSRQRRSCRAVRGLRRRGARAARPACRCTPSGASHSTTSSSAPKKSSRYSARLREQLRQHDDDDRRRPAGPSVQPAPPTITTSTNRIDCENGNESGVTKPNSGANSAPARPANSAERAKATVLTTTGLRPMTRRRPRSPSPRASPAPRRSRARRWKR